MTTLKNKTREMSKEIETEYLKKITIEDSNHSLLNKNDERILINLAQSDDKRAMELLVKYNRKLVYKIAHKYKDRGIDAKDIVSEGTIGFMHSVKKFDLSMKNICLSTYATLWIKQQIEKHIMNSSRMVRLPIHLIKKISIVNRKRQELSLKNGKTPCNKLISESIGISIEDIEKLDSFGKTVSVSNIQTNKLDNSFDLFDELIDNNSCLNSLEESLTLSKTNQLLECLSEKEKSVVILTFGMYSCEETSFREIGEQLNLTGERIRQIHTASIDKMKSYANINNISINDFLTAA
jgi:RNA polymerase sigma factor (sigma-70 family)